MVKSIAVEITSGAFLPEAYAYRDYFNRKGLKCDIKNKGDKDILNYDAVLLFHGIHPFWKKYPRVVIGEYHSLSTGKFGRLKDVIKRVINVRADCYIFLSHYVRKKMLFGLKSNTLIRGMGYEGANGKKSPENDSAFDIIYAGSERPGVRVAIEKLSNLGFSVAVVGFHWGSETENIVDFGKVSPPEVRALLHTARYGLNVTPDVHPLNLQDSTKVIEYCAHGLNVITNKYFWVREFERERGARFLDLSRIKGKSDVLDFEYVTPDVSDLEWGTVMENSGIFEFLTEETGSKYFSR